LRNKRPSSNCWCWYLERRQRY